MIVIAANPYRGAVRPRARVQALAAAVTGSGVPTRVIWDAGERARLLGDARALADVRCVVAAGGDGTVHEVANGVLQAGRPDVALAVFPLGSANDYAHSLGLDVDWWRQPAALQQSRPVDVGWVRASTGAERYFINSLGLGFNAEVTVESRRVRGLQGVPLYSVALLRALCYRFAAPVLRLAIDGQAWEAPTLGLSVALGFAGGGMLLAPGSVLDDGLFDGQVVDGAMVDGAALLLAPPGKPAAASA